MYHNMILHNIPKDLRGGVLLNGPKGLFQLEDALALADEVLESTHENHPDFSFLSADGKNVTVDQIEEILNNLELYPARAKRRCVVIDGAERIMAAGQNKLLKALEESEAFFILICYGTVISTVASRLMIVTYRPYSEEEFCKLTNEGGFAFYATGGCPELIKGEVKNIFEKAGNYMLHKQKKELLECLGLVKEKDKECFFEAYRDYVPSLFCYFGRLLVDNNGSFETIKKVADATLRCTKASVYTSADFFKDVVSIV